MAQTSQKAGATQGTALAAVHHGLRESALLLVVVVALYLLVSLLSFTASDPAWSHSGMSEQVRNLGGVAGAWIADIVLYFFGYPGFLLPPLLALGGWLVFRGQAAMPYLSDRPAAVRAVGLLVTLVAACGLSSLMFAADAGWIPGTAGGVLGDLASRNLVSVVSHFGAALSLIALLMTGLNLFTGLSWIAVVDLVGRLTLDLTALCVRLVRGVLRVVGPRLKRPPRVERVVNARSSIETTVAPQSREEPALSAPIGGLPISGASSNPEARVPSTQSGPHPSQKPRVSRTRKKVSAGQLEMGALGLPPMDLLDQAQTSDGSYAPDVLEALSRQVEEQLAHFGIQVEVVAVQPGPVITRFELQPAPGVKVSQISNLAKDMARGLSVIAVRVVEVIPGKSVVGLEIPNVRRDIVALREVLSSSVCLDASSPVTLALGKDIAGHPVVANLAKMPHLLVAGTTGSGKSVAINAMLLSMLYKSTPEEVRLILVDPKMLELSIYEGIPHLLAPVVTDMKDAASALSWCVAEMERRYKLMAALKVRNIAGFNAQVAEAQAAGTPISDPFYQPELDLDPDGSAPALEKLPFVVVVIDELADLIMVVGKKVEELIARLAQKARAAGIHLILATQRPSVDVITGLIKANIPTRIAFQVSSKVDSRTILDQSGAETLLGHGDMLYLPPGTGFTQRLHGAFVDDDEVNRVVEFLKASGEPDYVDSILEAGVESGGGASGEYDDGDMETDPLYDQAVRIVTETRRASASGIQRRLKIGYNRAARLIEAMEFAGIVSAQGSNGMREVLVAPPPEE